MADRLRRERHLERTGGRCWYCGISITVETMHLDHTVARIRGGKGGLVPTCIPCNTAKRDRSVEEFRWMHIRRRDDIPYFTPQQLNWLAENGFEFPECEPYVFWFEREGL